MYIEILQHILLDNIKTPVEHMTQQNRKTFTPNTLVNHFLGKKNTFSFYEETHNTRTTTQEIRF